MLFHYSKNRKKFESADFLDPVKSMLDKTWNLTGNFEPPDSSPGNKTITLFNSFFKRLNRIITGILKNIISLSSLSPVLFNVSSDFREKFKVQGNSIHGISDAGRNLADKIEEITENSKIVEEESGVIRKEIKEALVLGEKSMEQILEIEGFVGDLVATIDILARNSNSIESIIETIGTISEETGMLSLNARIEAARGSNDGKGFTVIAQEIADLAKQSSKSASDIKDQLSFLQNKIEQTVEDVKKVQKNVSSGKETISKSNSYLQVVDKSIDSLSDNLSLISEATSIQNTEVKSIIDSISGIEGVLNQQEEEVELIFGTAEKINNTCENMILSAGIFHLSNHEKAKEISGDLAFGTMPYLGNVSDLEGYMNSCINDHGFIELLYVTDVNGKQITKNIYSDNVPLDKRKKGFGNNWSNKDWFNLALKSEEPVVSNVYRSSATNNFCFTISIKLKDELSRDFGVIGIDINFEDILKIQ